MTHANSKLIRAVTLLLLTGLLAAPAAATASIGTGVGAVPLVLRTPGKAGHSYALPPLYVKNTGTVSSLYTIKVERISKGSQRTVPPAWVHVSRTVFRLRPGELRAIPVTVAIPAGASSGAYATDLVASTTTSHSPGSTALGAAAADRISFEVPSTASFPWLPVGLAGGGVILLLAAWVIRRSGVRPRLRVTLREA